MEESLRKKLKDSNGLAMPVRGVSSRGDDLRLEYENVLADRSDGGGIGVGDYRAESERIRDIDMAVDSSIKGNSNEYEMALVNFAGSVISPEDERRLKRERRKQANRESARKSRMRKQTEFEELTQSWDSLKMENSTLRSQLEQLYSDSEKLRRENSVLKEKLEVSEVQKGEMVSSNIGAKTASANHIEKLPNESDNLNTSLNLVRNENTNSGSKINQLLGPNSISDTVAAR